MIRNLFQNSMGGLARLLSGRQRADDDYGNSVNFVESLKTDIPEEDSAQWQQQSERLIRKVLLQVVTHEKHDGSLLSITVEQDKRHKRAFRVVVDGKSGTLNQFNQQAMEHRLQIELELRYDIMVTGMYWRSHASKHVMPSKQKLLDFWGRAEQRQPDEQAAPTARTKQRYPDPVRIDK